MLPSHLLNPNGLHRKYVVDNSEAAAALHKLDRRGRGSNDECCKTG